MTPTPERPTQVRHLIVFLTALVAVLLYLDRICLSTAEPYIREDLGLSKGTMGVLLSAFFWAYALAQVPAGWLGDRYGPRLMLSLYVVLWSVCTGLMGLADGFLALFILRLGCGLFEAGAYPACATVLGQWIPPAKRGLASGIVSVGGRLGGAAAPVLTAYLMIASVGPTASSRLSANDILDPQMLSPATFALLSKDIPDDPEQQAAALNRLMERPDLPEHLTFESRSLGGEAQRLLAQPAGELTPTQLERRNRLLLEAAYPEAVRKLYGAGWRPVMVLYGVAGIVIAAIFWALFRNRPSEHPGVNEAEVELIQQGRRTSGSQAPIGMPPFGAMVTNFSLWMNSLSQFATNFAWVFLITWFPTYLTDVHQVPVETRGLMQGVPIFVGMIGMVVGGWVTDWAASRFGLRWGRALPVFGSRLVVLGAFLGCLFHPSAWTVTLLMAVVALFTDLGTAPAWAYAQDVGGRHIGAVLGWGNMWGNLGAAVSPIVLPWIVLQYGWDGLFVACGIAALVAGLSGLGLDASRPIVRSESRPVVID